mmetsp:Transcript_78176/g.205176  ORF Transcript_78176/g.205176 Transcript_78176/m.205176 type:complete len:200 (-) Transcript_78176:22-621(-)
MGFAFSRLPLPGKKEDPPLSGQRYEGLSDEQKVHAAACNNDIRMLELLVEEGVSLDAPREQDGLSALDACAWSGATQGTLALLRLGADPRQTVQAVCGAAAWGNAEILEAMLDAGGPADQEHSQSSALRWSIEMGNEDCAEILVRKGAWKEEPEKDFLLRRAKKRRWKLLLDRIAEVDPSRKEECVLPPTFFDAYCTVL